MRVSSFFATHRFRPRLLPTAAMISVAALAIALGDWQRHRAGEKSATAALSSAAAGEAPLDLAASGNDVAAVLYRTVHGSGEYDAAHAVLIDNKVHQWFTTLPSGCLNKFDLQSVMVHERGHTAGLGHVDQTTHASQTMSPKTPACNTARRLLGAGDVLGLKSLYGA